MSLVQDPPAAAAAPGAAPVAAPATGAADRPDFPRLSLLAAGHAVTDSYGQSLLSPMFPLIARQMSLSLQEVGGLTTVMGLTASLAQPALGWLSDRYPRICMVALGPFIAAVFIGLVGYARNYGELAGLLLLAGVGIGAFHPQGATLARLAGRGSGLAMSAFTVGGNVGFGLAPLLGTFYAATIGLKGLYLAAIPAALFAVFMAFAFYAGQGLPASLKKTGGSGAGGSGNPVALAALTGTVVVRSAVQIGMTTFLPFLVEQRFPVALHETLRGVAVSAVLLASAVAGPIGGWLSDRFGRRRLMTGSFLLAPVPLLVALGLPEYGLIAGLAVGTFVLMLPHPGNVVMAQEFMPGSAGIAASLITGLAWGLAQLGTPLLGWCADQYSISAALTWLSLAPLVGVLMVIPIPERTR